MLSLQDRSTRLCDGINRRELLRIGGLSTLGLSLPTLLRAKESIQGDPSDRMFGRAKNVIFLWLQGGPPQHETFDPKPEAPAEIRGEFKPIQTNVPGIQFCELLPRIAARADKLAVVRSLTTANDLHDASGYWVLTGYRYLGQQSRQISRTDWPYLGSIIKMLKPSETAPALSSVWLPDMMRLNDNVTPAGQTAGFLGHAWEPYRLVCDPADPQFQVAGLTLPPELPLVRLSARQQLRDQFEQGRIALQEHLAVQSYSRYAQEALDLVTGGKVRSAFDLQQEPIGLREQYGMHTWGQSLILARRLIESGARLVHVNWPREGGDEAVNNPMWDTHAQNADRLQDVLCPIFDVGFAALLDDLEQRGLLDETLVVAIGEFGRTPKINSQGGRDHWGHVFSYALAGAGIRGGQVYGSSDRQGAFPRDGKTEAQDLTATIVHLLGIGHHATFPDATGRPFSVTTGEPLYSLLGTGPAHRETVASTGNLALVPPFTKKRLLNCEFDEDVPLYPAGSKQRLKGWQAQPLLESFPRPSWGVSQMARLREGSGTPTRQTTIGYSAPATALPAQIDPNSWALLTQEVRNPRAGTYTVRVHFTGGGSREEFQRFAENFRFRVMLFGYTELSKNPLKPRREFASAEINPVWTPEDGTLQVVELTRKLRSQESGANEIEMGVGLAVLVEKKSPEVYPILPGQSAFLAIDRFEFSFVPRPRNDDVTV